MLITNVLLTRGVNTCMQVGVCGWDRKKEGRAVFCVRALHEGGVRGGVTMGEGREKDMKTTLVRERRTVLEEGLSRVAYVCDLCFGAG